MAKCSTCICKNVTQMCMEVDSACVLFLYSIPFKRRLLILISLFWLFSINFIKCARLLIYRQPSPKCYIYICKMCSHWIILIGFMSFTVHFFQQSPAVHNLDYALHIGRWCAVSLKYVRIKYIYGCIHFSYYVRLQTKIEFRCTFFNTLKCVITKMWPFCWYVILTSMSLIHF